MAGLQRAGARLGNRSVPGQVLIVACLLAAVACASKVAPPTPAAPTVASDEPHIFGAGVISTEAPEFSISLSPDNRVAYYNRATTDRRSLMLLRSMRTNNGWTQGENVLSDVYRNVDPFLAPDGRRLYFSSTRPTSGTDTVADFNTWYIERNGDDWSDPRALGPAVDTDSAEIFVSVDKAGTMYFSSNRSGVSRVYSSKVVNGVYAAAELVEIPGNRAEGGGNPGVHPNGNMLVYVSGTTARADLYVTCLVRGAWTRPVALGGGVNTPAADFAPSFSPDGRTFFFTSERPGLGPIPNAGERPPGDIYYMSAAGVRAQCGS